MSIDYSKLSPEEINRLCAERLLTGTPCADRSIAAIVSNALMSPAAREHAEAELLYAQLASPRQHAIAFLLSTEEGETTT